MRFGLFEIDVEAGELLKEGRKVALQDQPFQLLCALIERPGEVVTREDLRQRLWPSDVHVDFERGLNKAVLKLRDALGDSAETPVFVQTLPKRGYRFIAPVSPPAETPTPVAAAAPALPESQPEPAPINPAGSTVVPTVRAHRRWRLALPLGAGVLAAGLGVWVARSPVGPGEARAPRALFSVSFAPDETLFEYSSASVALSPDGTHLAYVANRGAERAIYVRALDRLESRKVPGTEQAASPFCSPDGAWLAFESGGKLRKVPVGGGEAVSVADLPFFGGGDWGSDGLIVYAPVYTGGLFAVPAGGGSPRRLTTPGPGEAHVWPQVLPDGRSVLVTIWRGGSFDSANIGLLSLDNGQVRTVLEGGFGGRYSSAGRLLYMRGATLFAAPFDLAAGAVRGPAVPIVEGVLNEPWSGAAFYAVSHTGALAYAPGGSQSPARELVFVDRNGRRTPASAEKKPWASPRLAPDGRRLALYLEDSSSTLWVLELGTGHLRHVSFGPDDHTAVWSPDGRRIAFESGRAGVHQVLVRSADGLGADDAVTSGPLDHYLCDWSADGRTIAFVEHHPQTGADLWLVDLEGERRPRPFLRTRFAERHAAFSPDGRWIAYASDESGRYEVSVLPTDGTGPARSVSLGGGHEPAWSRSGHELYYRSGSRMMAVAWTGKPDLPLAKPRLVFEGLFHSSGLASRTYDVTPDGRFVMAAEPDPAQAARSVQVLVNWSAEPVAR